MNDTPLELEPVPVSNRRLVVWIARVLVAVLAAWAIFATALWLGSQARVDDLTTSARRNRPTADYIAGENKHQDCRKDHEDLFFAAQARFDAAIARALLNPDGSTEQGFAITDLKALGQLLDTYGANLERVGELCPAAVEPRFDPNGELEAPPVTFEQHPPASSTSTTAVPG